MKYGLMGLLALMRMRELFMLSLFIWFHDHLEEDVLYTRLFEVLT